MTLRIPVVCNDDSDALLTIEIMITENLEEKKFLLNYCLREAKAILAEKTCHVC